MVIPNHEVFAYSGTFFDTLNRHVFLESGDVGASFCGLKNQSEIDFCLWGWALNKNYFIKLIFKKKMNFIVKTAENL